MRSGAGFFDRARQRMVADQLASRDVRDPRVLAAMARIERHLFVEEALRDRAYDDHALPIGDGQTISQPFTVARMTEALDLSGSERVLEIGTGSGYQTAVLAQLCANVYSVERIPRLAARARRILDAAGQFNVAIQVGDGSIGWNSEAPFDAIIVTAGSPELPMPLLRQLAIGGRLVLPVGPEDLQTLVLIRRHEDRFEQLRIGDCRFVKLVGRYGFAA